MERILGYLGALRKFSRVLRAEKVSDSGGALRVGVTHGALKICAISPSKITPLHASDYPTVEYVNSSSKCNDIFPEVSGEK